MQLLLAWALLLPLAASGSRQSDVTRDLRDTDPKVRQAACTLLGHKGIRAAIPHLIELLKIERNEEVLRVAVEALENLTGQKGHGPDPKKWKDWWDAEGQKSFPISTLSADSVKEIIKPTLDEVQKDAEKLKTESRVLTITVGIVGMAFVLVMIYFVGHVSSKLKEWKDLVRQAEGYIEKSEQITKRTDQVLEELEAKKADILGFVKKLKEEKEAEIERYSDLLQQNTEHRMREEMMELRQKAEKELEETLSQLRQQVDVEVRRLGNDQKERIDKDFKAQHERFLKEVEAHTLFLQASFLHSQGKPEESLRVYKKLVALKPDHQVGWQKLGNVYRELQRLNEALEAYAKAVDLDPNDPSSHYNMAATYARLRKRDRMLETLAVAVKNDGEFKDEALNDPAFRDYWNDPAFKDLAEA